MKKLLHERIRDLKYSKTGEVRTRNQQANMIADDLGVTQENLFDAIADKIEKDYIPKPRYEDDDPVQGGDEFDKGYAHFAVIDLHHPNCYWLLEDYDGCLTETPIKRPQPKVLDADGVPIEVGDTLWDIKHSKHKKHTVIEVVPDDDCVICEDKLTYTPGYLIHEEPDSLESLRDDMEWHVKERTVSPYPTIKNFADRLSALIERGE